MYKNVRKMIKSKKFSVVIPVYNSENTIKEVYERLTEIFKEISQRSGKKLWDRHK